MDVERIQKVNNLALDLLKQGLAHTREEAIEQAEKIYAGKDTQEYNQVKETLHEVNQHKEQVQQKEQAPQTKLSQDAIEEILTKNTQFMVKTIKSFQEQIRELEKQIKELRTKVTYKNLPTAGEMVSKPEQAQQAAQPEQAKQQAAPQEKQQSHPRHGNFNDSDVSIEKFFYMGSR